MGILTTIQQKEELILDVLDFNIHYLDQKDELLQLREAILLAQEKDEDVLLFSLGVKHLPELSFEEINDTIIELATDGIYFLYVDVDSGKSIPINKTLSYINDIQSVRSFFMTRPLYHIALALLENKENYHCHSLNHFISWINIHQLKLSNNKQNLLQTQKINVISPFRNASSFLDEYLNSLQNQQYENYEVYLIDDCSTDNYNLSNQLNNKVQLTVNKTRKYALQNIVDNLLNNNYADEDIICFVDADDVLLHSHVFEIVNAIYSNNSNICLTYGAMTYYNSSRKNQKIGSKYKEEEFQNLRQSPWRMAHLRTFKYKLFKKLISIDPNLHCLRNQKGEIIKMPYDMAILFPLMELAECKGVEFINTPLYGYRTHQNNDANQYRDLQYEGELIIRGKTPIHKLN